MIYILLMNELHLGSVDLNLLVVLDALLVERNVTRAAARVGITQSAASHALARLRTLTDDELLVRGREGMVPTARAEALTGPVRRALDEIARALAPARPFDPKTATGKVRIGTSDYAELVLLPRLVQRLAVEAPGIDLRATMLGDDLSVLSTGELDLAITPFRAGDERAGLYAKRLLDETFVCVVRKGHPLAGKRLTLARYAAAHHALISPRGKEGGIVDAALAREGLSRRVVVAVPHFLIAPHIVARTDLVLTLAKRIASVVAEPLGLVVLPLPPEVRVDGFVLSAVWHERTQAEPMQRWVRGVIAEVAGDT
jgi:DNA-binding transcriptional LysR family regulator